MVEVKNISFAYNRSAKVLDNVSFEIKNNECLAILGNNGAGKSTLLKCIDKICHPKAGAVLVDGKNVFKMSGTEMARNIAFVPQENEITSMTVFDAVLLGRKPYISWSETAKDRQKVYEVIEQMGLQDFTLRNVAELSGGEAQKVMLARALAQEPRLLLLDEPTSNLDPRNQHDVMKTVRRIAREQNICVAIILHDLNLAIRYCDRFLFLKDSRVYAYGGLETVTPENIESVYHIHVHTVEYMGIPVIVPFPEEKPEH